MIILEALIYILPSYVANSCATLSLSIPILKKWTTPIDFGNSWNSKRILGDGKTFRGLIFGTLIGTIFGFLQYFLAQRIEFDNISFYNNASIEEILLISFLLSFGALLGDIVKSFIKRRFGIKRGRPWPPFDQTDFLIGGIIFSAIVYFPGWSIVLILFIITPIIHFLTNITAYLLKLKSVWW